MSKLDSLDLLIIKAHKKREYLYDGSLTAALKKKRKQFYTAFATVANKNLRLQLTADQVKARWRKLRENYVSADRQKNTQNLTAYQVELKEACGFLQPFIKHTKVNDSQQSNTEAETDKLEAETSKVDKTKILDENGQDVSRVPILDLDNEENCSDTGDIGDTFDNISNREECQRNLDQLCQQAIEEQKSTKTKRPTLDNLASDFPKKLKKQENFEVLDSQLENFAKLKKHSYRKSLHPQLKLSAVLNLLVHGGNVTNQSWFFLIGRSTMYEIIPEVCRSICQALDHYVQMPKGKEFYQKAKEFYELHGMPNTIGIVDGKHVPIKSPPGSGSWFRNFKDGYSINLMAMCDARGKIMWASVGDFGSKNDAGNFINSSLGIALAKEDVDFPSTSCIPKTRTKSPFFFLADGGFSLSKYLMTPFRQTKKKPLPIKCKIFNIRLQRPRKTIERVFGDLTKKWQIIENKLDFKLETTDLIVYAIIHLHNYLLEAENNATLDSSSDNDSETDNNDNSSSDIDSESDTSSLSTITSASSYESGNESETDVDEFHSPSSSESSSNSYESDTVSSDEEHMELEDAESVRNYLTEYFMSAKGNVSWQWLKL